MNLKGTYAEIGTYRAHFAAQIMAMCNPARLYCVDPYEKYDDFKDAINDEPMEELFQNAQKQMAPYKDRVTFLRMRSKRAVAQIVDNDLDFAYIDGNHSYPFAKQDIELWYPKVRTGGMLCGDDVIDEEGDSARNADGDVTHVWTRNERGEPLSWGQYGVLKALREFAQANRIEFYRLGSQFVIFKGGKIKFG
jgi:hypothetical protein